LQDHSFLIRPYNDKDEQEVIQLWRECHLIVPWNNPKLDIQRKLRVNPELFLVGTINSKVVATVMGGYEGHRGWINYLAISLDYRRLGFGEKIMRAVEEKIRPTGCPKINLQIRETNIEVIKFYESIGYKNDHVVSLGKRLIVD
jgi:ribosomal protein S18 acetylase RimI-like enzyme